MAVKKSRRLNKNNKNNTRRSHRSRRTRKSLKTLKYSRNRSGGGSIPSSITVIYENENKQSLQIVNGSDYTSQKSELQTEPMITLNININNMNPGRYILIMHDPNAPSGEYIHWITILNNQGEKITMPDMKSDILPYYGPNPPKGEHNYIFDVYNYSEELVKLITNSGISDSNRGGKSKLIKDINEKGIKEATIKYIVRGEDK